MLHLRRAGAGPALLLLHAGVADSRMWRPQERALADRYDVIAPDLRGYGGSPASSEPYGDAADVVAVLDDLGVHAALVTGCSYGGRVALQLAALAPDRVGGMVLVSPAYGTAPPDEQLAAFDTRESDLVEAGDVAAAVALNVATWVGPDADDATRELVADMQRHAFALQLAAPDVDTVEVPVDPAAISAPTVVVTGARDLGWFRAGGRELASMLPRGRSVELAWAGHLPSLERPEEFTRLLLRWLDELSQRPGPPACG